MWWIWAALAALLRFVFTLQLTPTNRFINNGLVTFTPTIPTGTMVTIKGVQSVSMNPQVKTIQGAGDADFYPSLSVAVEGEPTITVNTINDAVLNAVAPGTVGTLAWTQNDARNGATTAGGALIYTITNAVYTPGDTVQGHRVFGTFAATFTAYATDGITNPVAVAAA